MVDGSGVKLKEGLFSLGILASAPYFLFLSRKSTAQTLEDVGGKKMRQSLKFTRCANIH